MSPAALKNITDEAAARIALSAGDVWENLTEYQRKLYRDDAEEIFAIYDEARRQEAREGVPA